MPEHTPIVARLIDRGFLLAILALAYGGFACFIYLSLALARLAAGAIQVFLPQG